EALEVTPHAPRVDAIGRARGFRRPVRRIAQREADQRPRRATLLEGDGTPRLFAVFADPAEPPVGILLEDLRVPLGLPAADRRRPVQFARHLPQLTPQLLIGAEPAHGGDEADPARRATARDSAVADRREQLPAELLVLRERGGEVFPVRRLFLQYGRLAASEHAQSSRSGPCSRSYPWQGLAGHDPLGTPAKRAQTASLRRL